MSLYGLKTELFKKGLPIVCDKHGEHKDWGYNTKFRQIRCNLCQIERVKKHNKSDYYLFKKYIIWAKARCVKTGKKFNIDVPYIANLYIKQKGRCALSNIILNEQNLSLDRIDSNKGYIKGNIQWLDFSINRMKSDLKEELFILLCEAVASKRRGKK